MNCILKQQVQQLMEQQVQQQKPKQKQKQKAFPMPIPIPIPMQKQNPVQHPVNTKCFICIGKYDPCELSNDKCVHKCLEQEKPCISCKTKLTFSEKYSLNVLNRLEHMVYVDTLNSIKFFNPIQKNIFTDLIYYTYSKINVHGYGNFKVGLKLIHWFLETYAKTILIPTNKEYIRMQMVYKLKLFDIYKRVTVSKLVKYQINNYYIECTLAQANFICWFLNSNILEELVDAYKLFLIPGTVIF